jgi:hypothetical protein
VSGNSKEELPVEAANGKGTKKKESNIATGPGRHARGKKSVDASNPGKGTGDRLSIFGASFGGTLGRKPAPRYSGYVLTTAFRIPTDKPFSAAPKRRIKARQALPFRGSTGRAGGRVRLADLRNHSLAPKHLSRITHPMRPTRRCYGSVLLPAKRRMRPRRRPLWRSLPLRTVRRGSSLARVSSSKSARRTTWGG